MYSFAFGWNVLKISVRSISSNASFKTWIPLLVFCFDDMSTGVSEVLKSTIIIIMLLSFSSFMSVSVCLIGRLSQRFPAQRLPPVPNREGSGSTYAAGMSDGH